jgi:hypothetical protein
MTYHWMLGSGPRRYLGITWTQWIVVAGLLLITACDSTSETGQSAVQIQTVTQGTNVDPDGYSVSVDAGGATAIPANGELVIDGLAPGTHTSSSAVWRQTAL